MNNQSIPENNPALKSFVNIDKNSDFPIQNLPFGVFSTENNNTPRVGVAIGEYVLDLAIIEKKGLFKEILNNHADIFNQASLNPFMALGQSIWRAVRARVSELLRDDNPELRDDENLKQQVLIPRSKIKLHLPVIINGYTDFYSCKHHAFNVGSMFRGKENALMPNWTHLPVAYDGRASSVVVSGTNFKRPVGQIKLPDSDSPILSPSRKLDTEIEMAFIVGKANQWGEPINVNQTTEHVFGAVILADWSARDIQQWEYVPLGPFLGKNFCTSISPWVVMLDALEPYRKPGCEQDPTPLAYLQSTRDYAYDIKLDLKLKTQTMENFEIIAETNYQYVYWDVCQQLAHHTMGGCNMRTGDLFASGTISGPEPKTCGSLLEITHNGAEPIKLNNGEMRAFLEDHDTLSISGHGLANNIRIGFGEVRATVLPAN